MENEVFFDMIKEVIEDRGLEGITIQQSNVIKNNGITEIGISLVREGESISPNIYIEPYYREFLKGKPVTEIADEIIEQSQSARERMHFETEDFTEYDRAKRRIVFKLVNQEKNQKLLEQIPYVKYMDLAMVFYYLLPELEEKEVSGTILIHNQHLKLWGVTAEEVSVVAKRNTPRLLPAAIIGMGELLKSLMHRTDIPEEIAKSKAMYVMSNSRRMNGAATMAYPQTIQNFANSIGKNVYIIPSSVHEVILLPETGLEQNLNAVVSEVNRSQLDPKEVLADHVYYYDRKDDRMLGVLRETVEYC